MGRRQQAFTLSPSTSLSPNLQGLTDQKLFTELCQPGFLWRLHSIGLIDFTICHWQLNFISSPLSSLGVGEGAGISLLITALIAPATSTPTPLGISQKSLISLTKDLYLPPHLGNSQGFRKPMPEMETNTKDQIYISYYNHNITKGNSRAQF